jgi:hypothetical protein
MGMWVGRRSTAEMHMAVRARWVRGTMVHVTVIPFLWLAFSGVMTLTEGLGTLINKACQVFSVPVLLSVSCMVFRWEMPGGESVLYCVMPMQGRMMYG